jgi:Thiamine pyrophosphate enzyme, N-terminal TPP binding domain
MPQLAPHIFELLYEQGVQHAFGIPGDFALTLYDALVESPIEPIVMTHEPCVGFAADAYSRIRGLGLAVVTYSVGGLNMVPDHPEWRTRRKRTAGTRPAAPQGQNLRYPTSRLRRSHPLRRDSRQSENCRHEDPSGYRLCHDLQAPGLSAATIVIDAWLRYFLAPAHDHISDTNVRTTDGYGQR